MSKLTLNLNDTWAEFLADAARDAKVSTSEYLRQMIAHDPGVQAQAVTRVLTSEMPPIGKTWGKRKGTEVIEHKELPSHTEVTEVKKQPPISKYVNTGHIGWSKEQAVGKKSPAKKPTHVEEDF